MNKIKFGLGKKRREGNKLDNIIQSITERNKELDEAINGRSRDSIIKVQDLFLEKQDSEKYESNAKTKDQDNDKFNQKKSNQELDSSGKQDEKKVPSNTESVNQNNAEGKKETNQNVESKSSKKISQISVKSFPVEDNQNLLYGNVPQLALNVPNIQSRGVFTPQWHTPHSINEFENLEESKHKVKEASLQQPFCLDLSNSSKHSTKANIHEDYAKNTPDVVKKDSFSIESLHRVENHSTAPAVISHLPVSILKETSPVRNTSPIADSILTAHLPDVTCTAIDMTKSKGKKTPIMEEPCTTISICKNSRNDKNLVQSTSDLIRLTNNSTVLSELPPSVIRSVISSSSVVKLMGNNDYSTNEMLPYSNDLINLHANKSLASSTVPIISKDISVIPNNSLSKDDESTSARCQDLNLLVKSKAKNQNSDINAATMRTPVNESEKNEDSNKSSSNITGNCSNENKNKGENDPKQADAKDKGSVNSKKETETESTSLFRSCGFRKLNNLKNINKKNSTENINISNCKENKTETVNKIADKLCILNEGEKSLPVTDKDKLEDSSSKIPPSNQKSDLDNKSSSIDFGRPETQEHKNLVSNITNDETNIVLKSVSNKRKGEPVKLETKKYNINEIINNLSQKENDNNRLTNYRSSGDSSSHSDSSMEGGYVSTQTRKNKSQDSLYLGDKSKSSLDISNQKQKSKNLHDILSNHLKKSFMENEKNTEKEIASSKETILSKSCLPSTSEPKTDTELLQNKTDDIGLKDQNNLDTNYEISTNEQPINNELSNSLKNSDIGVEKNQSVIKKIVHEETQSASKYNSSHNTTTTNNNNNKLLLPDTLDENNGGSTSNVIKENYVNKQDEGKSSTVDRNKFNHNTDFSVETNFIRKDKNQDENLKDTEKKSLENTEECMDQQSTLPDHFTNKRKSDDIGLYEYNCKKLAKVNHVRSNVCQENKIIKAKADFSSIESIISKSPRDYCSDSSSYNQLVNFSSEHNQEYSIGISHKSKDMNKMSTSNQIYHSFDASLSQPTNTISQNISKNSNLQYDITSQEANLYKDKSKNIIQSSICDKESSVVDNSNTLKEDDNNIKDTLANDDKKSLDNHLESSSEPSIDHNESNKRGIIITPFSKNKEKAYDSDFDKNDLRKSNDNEIATNQNTVHSSELVSQKINNSPKMNCVNMLDDSKNDIEQTKPEITNQVLSPAKDREIKPFYSHNMEPITSEKHSSVSSVEKSNSENIVSDLKKNTLNNEIGSKSESILKPLNEKKEKTNFGVDSLLENPYKKDNKKIQQMEVNYNLPNISCDEKQNDFSTKQSESHTNDEVYNQPNTNENPQSQINYIEPNHHQLYDLSIKKVDDLTTGISGQTPENDECLKPMKNDTESTTGELYSTGAYQDKTNHTCSSTLYSGEYNESNVNESCYSKGTTLSQSSNKRKIEDNDSLKTNKRRSLSPVHQSTSVDYSDKKLRESPTHEDISMDTSSSSNINDASSSSNINDASTSGSMEMTNLQTSSNQPDPNSYLQSDGCDNDISLNKTNPDIPNDNLSVDTNSGKVPDDETNSINEESSYLEKDDNTFQKVNSPITNECMTTKNTHSDSSFSNSLSESNSTNLSEFQSVEQCDDTVTEPCEKEMNIPLVNKDPPKIDEISDYTEDCSGIKDETCKIYKSNSISTEEIPIVEASSTLDIDKSCEVNEDQSSILPENKVEMNENYDLEEAPQESDHISDSQKTDDLCENLIKSDNFDTVIQRDSNKSEIDAIPENEKIKDNTHQDSTSSLQEHSQLSEGLDESTCCDERNEEIKNYTKTSEDCNVVEYEKDSNEINYHSVELNKNPPEHAIKASVISNNPEHAEETSEYADQDPTSFEEPVCADNSEFVQESIDYTKKPEEFTENSSEYKDNTENSSEYCKQSLECKEFTEQPAKYNEYIEKPTENIEKPIEYKQYEEQAIEYTEKTTEYAEQSADYVENTEKNTEFVQQTAEYTRKSIDYDEQSYIDETEKPSEYPEQPMKYAEQPTAVYTKYTPTEYADKPSGYSGHSTEYAEKSSDYSGHSADYTERSSDYIQQSANYAEKSERYIEQCSKYTEKPPAYEQPSDYSEESLENTEYPTDYVGQHPEYPQQYIEYPKHHTGYSEQHATYMKSSAMYVNQNEYSEPYANNEKSARYLESSSHNADPTKYIVHPPHYSVQPNNISSHSTNYIEPSGYGEQFAVYTNRQTEFTNAYSEYIKSREQSAEFISSSDHCARISDKQPIVYEEVPFPPEVASDSGNISEQSQDIAIQPNYEVNQSEKIPSYDQTYPVDCTEMDHRPEIDDTANMEDNLSNHFTEENNSTVDAPSVSKVSNEQAEQYTEPETAPIEQENENFINESLQPSLDDGVSEENNTVNSIENTATADVELTQVIPSINEESTASSETEIPESDIPINEVLNEDEIHESEIPESHMLSRNEIDLPDENEVPSFTENENPVDDSAIESDSVTQVEENLSVNESIQLDSQNDELRNSEVISSTLNNEVAQPVEDPKNVPLNENEDNSYENEHDDNDDFLYDDRLSEVKEKISSVITQLTNAEEDEKNHKPDIKEELDITPVIKKVSSKSKKSKSSKVDDFIPPMMDETRRQTRRKRSCYAELDINIECFETDDMIPYSPRANAHKVRRKNNRRPRKQCKSLSPHLQIDKVHDDSEVSMTKQTQDIEERDEKKKDKLLRNQWDLGEDRLIPPLGEMYKGSNKCEKCDLHFLSQCQLQQHYRTHSHDELPLCSICSRVFTTETQLENHIEQQHTQLFSCSLCGGIFNSATSLRKHDKQHDSGLPYECSACSAAFATASALSRHSVVHSDLTCAIVRRLRLGRNLEKDNYTCVSSRQSPLSLVIRKVKSQDSSSLVGNRSSGKETFSEPKTTPWECGTAGSKGSKYEDDASSENWRTNDK